MGVPAPAMSSVVSSNAEANGRRPFVPKAMTNFDEAGLNLAMVESLVLKFLVNIGIASGRRIAEELGLPFGPFPEFLRGLKNQQILAYANSASANDYLYSLTDTGRARAKMYFEECAYVGTAPVPFDDYLESVAAQTITTEHPKEDDLRRAFSDLLISEEMFAHARPGHQLGPRACSSTATPATARPASPSGSPAASARPSGSPGSSTSRARSSSSSTWRTTSRSSRATRRPARRVRLRPPLDRDPPADDRRRRRAAGWKTSRSTTTPSPRSARPRCRSRATTAPS